MKKSHSYMNNSQISMDCMIRTDKCWFRIQTQVPHTSLCYKHMQIFAMKKSVTEKKGKHTSFPLFIWWSLVSMKYPYISLLCSSSLYKNIRVHVTHMNEWFQVEIENLQYWPLVAYNSVDALIWLTLFFASLLQVPVAGWSNIYWCYIPSLTIVDGTFMSCEV